MNNQQPQRSPHTDPIPNREPEYKPQLAATWAIRIAGELTINVPADIHNPTVRTLLEHEDWPAPEHAFLRHLIQPGMRLLDADTGYGVYALAMAQALQGRGELIGLNADPLFARSVAAAANQLDAVVRTLDASDDRAADDGPSADGAETLDLIRLGATPLPTEADAASAQTSTQTATPAPLAEHWLRRGRPILLGAACPAMRQVCVDRGLDLYRLIPALGALVPADEFAINGSLLFALHADIAQRLHARNLLLNAEEALNGVTGQRAL